MRLLWIVSAVILVVLTAVIIRQARYALALEAPHSAGPHAGRENNVV